MAASRTMAEYSNLAAQYSFFQIADESHGPLFENAHGLLRNLGRRLSELSRDVREVQFLYQRISVVQRFNAVLLHDSFFVDEQPGRSSFHSIFYIFFHFSSQNPLVIYLPWV